MPNAEAVRIAVVGGGAAGLFAAGVACAQGASVTVYEHMPKPGAKLLITGKGRCNVTNNCDRDTFLSSVNTNPRFLYSALAALTPQDTMRFFEELGVPLKTERGRRVFPVSDKAGDILSALRRHAKDAKIVHRHVERLLAENGEIRGVVTDREEYYDAVIVATGGASFPLTGSDGSGYKLAREVGHTVTPIMPSLVPLESEDPVCPAMQGLSLKNVRLTLREEGGRIFYSDFGEMLFTHFGISGPLVLTGSAHVREADFDRLVAEIDLKPTLDEKTLDARLLSELTAHAKKDAVNLMATLLPQMMVLPFLSRVGIDPRKKAYEIGRQERLAILHTLKHFTVKINAFRPLKDAIVTAGGVSVQEIHPKTMESKLIRGLYFAGEVIDVDAYTGGYSLQIAFSTGYLAGLHSATDNEKRGILHV